MVTEKDLRRRCLELRHKCVLMRQIHSLKMERFQRLDSVLNIGTLLAAAFLTFIGFFGLSKITKVIPLAIAANMDMADLGYNLMVFVVLVFSILNVAFHFKDKAFQHWRAINLMTDFVTDIDNLLVHSSFENDEIEKYMSFVSYRYKHVVDMLPPSTDDDYFKAKKSLARKELTSKGAKVEAAATT